MDRDPVIERRRFSPYALESILDEPLTEIRLRAIDAWRKKTFTPDDYFLLVNELAAKNRFHPDFTAEAANAIAALNTGECPRPPNPATPEAQLLWFMTFSCMQLNMAGLKPAWGDKAKTWENVTDAPPWQQIENSQAANEELFEIYSRTARELRNPNVRIGWEPPGKWFYFNPEDNYIGLDLLMALAGGFEHCRAILGHEFWHSQYTVRFSDRERELSEALKPYQDKIREKGKLSVDEYRQMRTLQAEFSLRHELTDKVENCVVNRAAAGSSFTHYQDYFYSLNNTCLTVSGFGADARTRLQKFLGPVVESAAAPPLAGEFNGGADPRSQARRHFDLIQKMINLTFFSNNHLFPNREEYWQVMGVDPAMIRARPLGAPAPEPSDAPFPLPDFQWLHERCSDLELMQPRAADRMRGRASFNLKIDQCADERMAIGDAIWDRFLAQDAAELLAEEKQKIEQNLQQAIQDAGAGEGDDDDNDNDADGDPQAGSGKGGKKGKAGKGGEPGEDEEMVEVEGAGQMPIKKLPKEKGRKGDGDPGQENEKDGQKGEQKKSRRGKSVEEILNEIRKAREKQAQKGDKPGSGDEPGDDEAGGKQASAGGTGRTLEDMAKGDWKDYEAKRAEAAGLIEYVASMLQMVRQRQIEADIERSDDLTLLPEDNELDRLEQDAHRNLVIMQQAGQMPEEQDRKRWERDQAIYVPTLVDLLILIDGSSSMYSAYGSKDDTAMPLETALWVGMIFYEAGRKAGMNVTVGMWGSDNPQILARPGDATPQVRENFVKARAGLNSGTSLWPSLPAGIEVFANQKLAAAENAGFVHAEYLSDGDIDDPGPSEKAIEGLLQQVPFLTFDVGIVERKGATTKTKMETMFESLIKKHGNRRLGCVANSDRNQLPIMIVQNMIERMIRNNSFVAVPFAERQDAFRHALHWLKANKAAHLKAANDDSQDNLDLGNATKPATKLTPG